MQTSVDKYLVEGCLRCKYGATPDCKVHKWQEVLIALRAILQKSELFEEVKWGMPCYTINGKNVLILSAFKDFVTLNFFKGSAMNDPIGLLEKQGANAQVARIMRFTTLDQVIERTDVILDYLEEAIQLEKSGVEIHIKREAEPIPNELSEVFSLDKEYEKAFAALTPGRQRGYLMHFNQPKNSETKRSRIVKCRSLVLGGKGLQGR